MLLAASGLHFNSTFFWHSLVGPSTAFLQGLETTVYLAVISQALATIIGLLLAVARRSKILPLRAFVSVYSWAFRGTPLLIHQPSYSMINRWIEGGLLGTLGELGVGCIAFSPLAQGLLTDR